MDLVAIKAGESRISALLFNHFQSATDQSGNADQDSAQLLSGDYMALRLGNVPPKSPNCAKQGRALNGVRSAACLSPYSTVATRQVRRHVRFRSRCRNRHSPACEAVNIRIRRKL